MSSSLFRKSGLARIMRSALFVTVATLVMVVALAVCGCGESTGTLVGKWTDADGTWEWEFTADGKVNANMYVGMEPDYTVENGTIIVTNNGVPMNTFQYVVEGDNLVLTNPEAEDSLTLQRVN